jgi:hypothetical protein
MPSLRIDPNSSHPTPPFHFQFEGRPIPAYPGETIGAALTAAGITGRRPRGVFCGIGVCYDCLLVVDGAPNQRACLTPARPDATVHIQQGNGEAPRGA